MCPLVVPLWWLGDKFYAVSLQLFGKGSLPADLPEGCVGGRSAEKKQGKEKIPKHNSISLCPLLSSSEG